MNLLVKTLRLGVLAAALAAVAGFDVGGGGSVVQAQANIGPADYVGIWRLMFQGKAFATLTIEQKGLQFVGSLTGVSIEMDDNGKLTNAVANGGAPSTLHAALENGGLHLTEKDGDDVIEWMMTLSSPKTGELRFAGGAPASAEGIKVEKVWSEPPVEK